MRQPQKKHSPIARSVFAENSTWIFWTSTAIAVYLTMNFVIYRAGF